LRRRWCRLGECVAPARWLESDAAESGRGRLVLSRGATGSTLVRSSHAGVMPMCNDAPAIRAGNIGPVRREIVFEPLPDRPVPVEDPAVTPDQPKEPVPARP
jgi:hypothetical protein